MNQHKLMMWKERYENAEREYNAKLSLFDKRMLQYKGDKRIETEGRRGRSASIVRNFTFELIEAQIDNSVPMPKVTSPIHSARKERNARVIEAMLRSVIRRLAPEKNNAEAERMTKVMGQSYTLVGWDNGKSTHTTCGEPYSKLLSPKQVIPQPGIDDIENMDYVFVSLNDTKERLNRRYNADIDAEELSEENPYTENTSEVITQITAYYINKKGTLGVFSWAGNTVLEDYEEYNARLYYICNRCGAAHSVKDTECSCGGKATEPSVCRGEKLCGSIVRADGTVIPAFTETEHGLEPTVIPYYTPTVFPVIMRKNISIYGQYDGLSDCDLISDLQTAHNKLYTKLQDKMLKGGSVLTLPKGLKVEASDREDKLVYLDNAAQKMMVDAINLQPSIGQDYQVLAKYYEDARSTLGVTDAFQGKQDATAISGTAKQFSAAQAAGRIESKAKLKNTAFRDIFKAIFQYMLAYADEERVYGGPCSEAEASGDNFVFNRYDFLERDAEGNWYYDDDYIFEVDSNAVLLSDRQAMWSEVRSNFRDGTFGNPSLPQTLAMYWKQLEHLDYPNASSVSKQIELGEEVTEDE